MAANLPVTPGGCQRRRVCSHLMRRVISLPGQHQMFPHPWHLKVPRLSWAVGQGPCPVIPHDWPPNTIVQGGKKDLEHVLMVYYKYNTASFKGAEWVQLRDKFFTHFLPHKEEALGIKERCPMDYMPYIEEHFWRARGLLHKCPHLAGVPLPRWPQVTPSESHWESQKKAETPATSSSEPSTGATATPVTETPVAQTPVAETPVTRSDTPAPMETGGVGDSQSWAE